MTRRFGPEAHIRLNSARAITEGQRCAELHLAGHSFRTIATMTGLSTTTAWRRTWLYIDWVRPTWWGNPLPRQPPPQRCTERCPSGRPWVAGHDGPADHPRPRNTVPGRRCGRRRTDGGSCRRWCRRGGVSCPGHGSSTRAAREAADRRVERVEALAAELSARAGRDVRHAVRQALQSDADLDALFSRPDDRRTERRARTRQRRAAA